MYKFEYTLLFIPIWDPELFLIWTIWFEEFNFASLNICVVPEPVAVKSPQIYALPPE